MADPQLREPGAFVAGLSFMGALFALTLPGLLVLLDLFAFAETLWNRLTGGRALPWTWGRTTRPAGAFSVDGVDSRQLSTELTVGIDDSRAQAQWLGRVSESGSVVAESPIAALIWN
ncbi:hypothetical protein R3Q06_13105 [Rhodococcus erythropolis]|uniref:hypothetical protein n=1 Tax=Rhodococcus erythropolis TaxID=1833 RepID=UPI00294A825C|nr:hypothetical protein [Rhodococcus erythropolis]MDV6274438.1 hypothetical protein [Rhodococcus erythropolis]